MNEERSTRIVAYWIFLGVVMLIVQTLLGGITRLTGSGLSITEWKPIMGILPPLSQQEWQVAFEKYRHIAQFKVLNSHFTLHDFKMIFFWEWFHRAWARLIGVVFLIPFVYFLIKGYFKKWMITPLIILFLLGALQGAIGWIMVKSGLNNENLYVNHIRLAIHFISAMVLICYTLIFGLMLFVPQRVRIADKGLRTFTILLIALITVQLFYGACIAGLKGAGAVPTWPDINGRMVPAILWKGNLVDNLFFNIISIHFIHRALAYILLVLILFWWSKARLHNNSRSFNEGKHWPLILVITQVLLGILTVLSSSKIVPGHFGVFEWMALLHQLTGMLLLLSLVASLYMLRSKRTF
jgi:cytochrome c oxidase assembly protein subunit 15